MSDLNEMNLDQLLRDALEADPLVDSEPCGSYTSLVLLMAGSDSHIVSQDHIAQCPSCTEMLTRLLRHRCPAFAVLRKYCQAADGFARATPLERHFDGCRWCRARLVVAGAKLPVHWIALASAGLAVVLAVSSSWLAFQLVQQRKTAEERERRWLAEKRAGEDRIEQLNQRLAESGAAQDGRPGLPAEKAGGSVFPALVLLPGIMRDADADRDVKTLTLAPGATIAQVRLETNVPLLAKFYQVGLRRENEDSLWSVDVPRPADRSASTLSVTVPADILHNGWYFVTLAEHDAEGRVNVIHDYVFRVR